jgi:putative serine protease PepD
MLVGMSENEANRQHGNQHPVGDAPASSGATGPGPNPGSNPDSDYRHRYGDPTSYRAGDPQAEYGQGHAAHNQPGQPGQPGQPDYYGPGASGAAYAGAGYGAGDTGYAGGGYGGGGYGQGGYGPADQGGTSSDTLAYDSRSWGPQASYFGQPGSHGHAPTADPKRGRGGRGAFAAAVLAGALIVGGIAGLGGAAGFSALSSLTDGGSSGNGSITSSVVDRKNAPAKNGSVQAVAESVLPSVVKINVTGAQGAGSGSGVIISDDGEILTNFHVVALADQGGNLSVGFNDGSTAPAEIVGTDPLTDLAVIKAQGVSGLQPATLGESGNLDVGEEVVAIGSPFGLDATVTSGIVSALQRPVSISGQGSSIDTAYPAIQTDAAINPGNSGGPLVNMNGEVVGINSSIRTASSSMSGQGGSIGLGFAIPLDQVLPIVDQLRSGETATHARLGVSVVNASSENGLMSGAGIAEVSAGSAADKAGLQRGDIIVRVDDLSVSDASSLVASIRGHRPGDDVTLTVVRGNDQTTIDATLDSDQGQPAS